MGFFVIGSLADLREVAKHTAGNIVIGYLHVTHKIMPPEIMKHARQWYGERPVTFAQSIERINNSADHQCLLAGYCDHQLI